MLHDIGQLGIGFVETKFLRPRHVRASQIGAFDEGIEELGIGFCFTLVS